MTSTTSTSLILGGNGKIGRRVAQQLRELGRPVRIGSRSGEPPFDWDVPGTWAPALAGAAAVFVSYQPDLAFPGAAGRVAGLAAAAAAAGVRRVVLLSGRNEEGALASESAIKGSGLDWTIVCSSFFNQNFSETFFLDPILDGTLAFPAGAVGEPFIDAEDVADVVAAALIDDRHVGEDYEVTGPELLTFADAMASISAAVGRDIAYQPITLDEFAHDLRVEGLPEDDVAAYVDLFGSVLDGRNSSLGDGVDRALGRAPRTFREYAERTAATGIWDVDVRRQSAAVRQPASG